MLALEEIAHSTNPRDLWMCVKQYDALPSIGFAPEIAADNPSS